PTASGPTALANHANFNNTVANLTDVGAYTGTTSPYGAFDMNGNAFQWIEGLFFAGARTERGGAFYTDSSYLASSGRAAVPQAFEGLDLGFRVASVPEPSAWVLAALGAVSLTALTIRRLPKSRSGPLDSATGMFRANCRCRTVE